MNARKWWRCWFREHEYVYREVHSDPADPASAESLKKLCQIFGVNKFGLKVYKHCNRSEGPVVLGDTGDMIPLEQQIESRYDESI